ncbi:MAG: PAS domain-containing protein [Gammaproteobacteria bacterium]|nr:PAS domain-containing protein [Gammaproteobacteria bacterium]
MRPACVECHNSHPDTPKNDWKTGDLRGILEINLSLDQVIAQTQANLKGTIAIFGSIALLGVIGIGSVIGKLRRTSVELQHRVQRRTAKLAKISTHLQHLIDNSPAIIYSAMPNDDFTITFVSDNLRNVLGYEPQKMLDHINFWFEHIHLDDQAGLMQRLRRLLAEGGQQTLDYRFRHRDGHYLWMHDSIRVVYDSSGAPLELLGSLLDITNRKAMEEALYQEKEEQRILIQKLQEARDQLLQNEKMAAIGQLAAGVAHEINNPIGYINSNLGTLQRYTDNLIKLIEHYQVMEGELKKSQSEPVKQHLALIEQMDFEYIKEDLPDLVRESQEGAERVRKIVQDLKEFSHVDEVAWQWADLHQGLESTLNIVHNELKYTAEICKAYGELPQVECLASQINQVFMNLLVNAAHAIEKHGVITLRTGCENNEVWVEISDTGKGIPADKLKRIFDPFYTTKPVGVGTGLGLSLSYSIIKKHHGRIEVVSEINQGSRFTIYLPIKRQNDPIKTKIAAQNSE